MTKVVAMLGTLDLKGAEYAYLKARIEAQGVATLVIDAGVLGEPPFPPEIAAAEVAAAGGSSLPELRARNYRGAAMAVMSRGAAALLAGLGGGWAGRRRHRDGRWRWNRYRGGRHAGPAGRLSEADRLDARLGRHQCRCRGQGRHADAGRRRHCRHQPAVCPDPRQCGRCDRGHGRGRAAGGCSGKAADCSDYVRRHHAVRDHGARSAGKRRLRSAGLSRRGHRRPFHGGAGARRLYCRGARHHHHRIGRRTGGRRAQRRCRPPGSGRRAGRAAGGLAGALDMVNFGAPETVPARSPDAHSTATTRW